MFSEEIKVKGNLLIQRFDGDCNLVESRKVNNLVVQAGKIFIAQRILNSTDPVMSHMAIGAGTTTPVSTDVALTTEIARVALTSASNADNVLTYVASYAAGVGTGALTEAGIFNNESGGTMLAHTTFAVVNKGPNDSISITWSITIQ